MAYSKNKLEVHSMIAAIYERYRDKGFIHFRNVPDIKGVQYIESLIKAIEEKKVLRITYLPFYEDKPYFNEIHPYLLKEHDFRWYLVAWNEFKGQLRTYALDRIRAIEISEGKTYRDPGFSASDYFKYTLGIISPPGAPPLVRIAVQRTQAQYLINQPWHESQNIEEENEDELVFSFRLHSTYELKSLILGLGKDARVLSPESLIKELADELKSMLASYS